VKPGACARVLDAIGVAAGAAFALIALATTWDVLLRNLAGGTLAGLGDLVEYILFVATFLAAPWLLRENGHVQVDFLVAALPAPLRRSVRRAANAVGLAVCAVLLVFAARVAWTSWTDHNMVLKTLVFPEWWLYAVIVVSMALLSLEFLRRLWAGSDAAPPPPDF